MARFAPWRGRQYTLFPGSTVAELSDGYKNVSPEDAKKAKVFFDRAKVVADTGNYDYGIEMYLQGLRFDPDLTAAHKALQAVSLIRKGTGGKPMGMKDRWSLPKVAKDDHKQAMLNAEKQLSYDPGNVDHMLAVLTSAQKGGFYETVIWIGDLLSRALAGLPKPDISKYTTLKDVFVAIGDYNRAMDALAVVVRANPADMDLSQEMKDLGTKATIKKGRYEEGDFRSSMRDVDAQKKLLVQDQDIRTLDAMAKPIADAEADFAAEPGDAGKFARLVELLKKTETEEYENRAIGLLDQRFLESKAYKFKQQAGLIRIAQMGRRERALREDLHQKSGDAQALKNLQDFLRYRYEQELAYFRETSANYPTDSASKFETGKRLFLLGQFEESIGVFQDVRNDPKYRADASTLLGRAFLSAQFYDEAVDTLQAAVDAYPIKGDEKAIELYYWLARGFEEQGNIPGAIKTYSQVAQWRFTFRDVQARIKRLRGINKPPPAAGADPTPGISPI